MKILQSFEDWIMAYPYKVKQLKMRQEKKRSGFLGVLLGAFDGNLLENALLCKGVIRTGDRVIGAASFFD